MSVSLIPVGTIAEIEEKGAKQVTVDGQTMLVAHVEGEYVAFSDVCPHMQFALWPEDIKGTRVFCVGHNYTFDTRTGACIYPSGGRPLTTMPVEELDGFVYIRVE